MQSPHVNDESQNGADVVVQSVVARHSSHSPDVVSQKGVPAYKTEQSVFIVQSSHTKVPELQTAAVLVHSESSVHSTHTPEEVSQNGVSV